MENQKEREEFEIAYSEIFSPIVKRPYPVLENGDYKYVEIDQAWKLWQAKSQAVPERFVLLEKKNLRDTYYLADSEYVVDDPAEYELELECGEIATLEKWQRTKEIKVFCANIYSDEDDFEVVEFESIEDAEKAIAENKAIFEAQEQSHD